MGKKTYRRYCAEFKEQVLGLVALGKPVAEVAQEFEVSSNLIYEWRLRQSTQGGSAGQLAPKGELPEADALRALRRENTRLLAENDILKKAAVILGTKPHLNGAK